MDQLSGKQLRQRRTRILRDQAKEYREEQRIKDTIRSSQSSGHILKLYLVIGAALVVTFISFLQYTRPKVLMNLMGFGGPKTTTQNADRNKRLDPYYMATFYPPSVVADRDLPRFFRHFSIATPENEAAQDAMKKVIQSREALKRGAGRMKVWLKAWDASTVQQVLDRNLCGADFSEAYATTTTATTASKERREDLILWCLLTTRLADGVFLDSVQMIQGRMSPLLLAKKRGMVVRRSSSTSSGGGGGDNTNSSNEYLHSFYVHPQNLNYTSTFAILPSKVLSYLLDEVAAERRNEEEPTTESVSEYRQALQEHIFQLVHANGSAENYLELQEVCQAAPPPMGAIAESNCDEAGHYCCYFVLPESEAKRFVKREDGDEDVEIRRSLRESASSEGNNP
jgi:hypothetical protein